MKTQRGSLVAVPTRPAAPFWDMTLRIWDAGAAVFPVDPSLPRPAIAGLYEAVRPAADPAGAPLAGAEPVEDGVAFVVATSGSTGAPKGVPLTHANLQASAAATRRALGDAGAAGWLGCLPLSHIAGLMTCVRTHLAGLTPAIHEGFDPAAVAGAAGLCLALVPAMLDRLLASGSDLSRHPVILLGGGPIPAPLVRRAREAGGRVVASYGATETCGGVVYDGLPVPGAQVRLSHDGEVLVAGGMVAAGYRLDPASSAEAFSDGWFRTGDDGEFGPGGRLAILGRRDGMIISGGEKVSPEEVEAALAAHPSVADVAVAGVPDPHWGEVVTAVVVVAGAPPSTEELREWARPTLAAYKLPRAVVTVPAIPRSPLGKPLRAAIRRLAAGEG